VVVAAAGTTACCPLRRFRLLCCRRRGCHRRRHRCRRRHRTVVWFCPIVRRWWWFLAEDSGLETGDGEVNVIARSVERNLPLQGGRSLFEVDDMRASQSHAQLSSLVRRRALDLFFLAHGDEFLKDFGEEGDLLSSGQLLQHRLQEQLLVVRRIYQDGLVEDVAVVVFARKRGFLDVAHDGVVCGVGLDFDVDFGVAVSILVCSRPQCVGVSFGVGTLTGNSSSKKSCYFFISIF